MIFDKLRKNAGAITLGLGLANLIVWVFQAPSVWFLITGLLMTGIGLIDLAAEYEKCD
jgi:hypothetical protein